MTQAALLVAQAHFSPPKPAGRAPAMGVALLAHGLLAGALALSTQWKRSAEPEVFAAELWSAMPVAAAPAATPAPEPPPAQAAPPALPPPAPAPAPAPPPAPAPVDIAVEKPKPVKPAPEEKKAPPTAPPKEPPKNLTAEKAKAKALADQQREEAQAQARQQEQTQRMLALANAGGTPNTPVRNLPAGSPSGPSASYEGRVIARIRSNIAYTGDTSQDIRAEVEIRVAADGTILSRRLLKSSGNPAWDDAVLKAVDKAEVMPKDTDGRVPPLFNVGLRPRA